MSAAATSRSTVSRFGAATVRRDRTPAGGGRYIAILGELDSFEANGTLFSFRSRTHVLLMETADHKIELSNEVEGFKPGLEIAGIGYLILPAAVSKRWHPFGEEGGDPPHLQKLPSGIWRLEGGSYYVAPEGIRD